MNLGEGETNEQDVKMTIRESEGESNIKAELKSISPEAFAFQLMKQGAQNSQVSKEDQEKMRAQFMKVIPQKQNVENYIIIEEVESEKKKQKLQDNIGRILFLLSKKFGKKVDQNLLNAQIKYHMLKNNIKEG